MTSQGYFVKHCVNFSSSPLLVRCPLIICFSWSWI